eukprot:6032919-Amphidinium_carterae.1
MACFTVFWEHQVPKCLILECLESAGAYDVLRTSVLLSFEACVALHTHLRKNKGATLSALTSPSTSQPQRHKHAQWCPRPPRKPPSPD